jgi:hypothetical protein
MMIDDFGFLIGDAYKDFATSITITAKSIIPSSNCRGVIFFPFKNPKSSIGIQIAYAQIAWGDSPLRDHKSSSGLLISPRIALANWT